MMEIDGHFTFEATLATSCCGKRIARTGLKVATSFKKCSFSMSVIGNHFKRGISSERGLTKGLSAHGNRATEKTTDRECGLEQASVEQSVSVNVRPSVSLLSPHSSISFFENRDPWKQWRWRRRKAFHKWQLTLWQTKSHISIASWHIRYSNYRMKLFYGLIIHSKSIDDLLILPNTALVVEHGKVNNT